MGHPMAFASTADERGLTLPDGGALYFEAGLPDNSLGGNGDRSLGPDGAVYAKMAGAWAAHGGGGSAVVSARLANAAISVTAGGALVNVPFVLGDVLDDAIGLTFSVAAPGGIVLPKGYYRAQFFADPEIGGVPSSDVTQIHVELSGLGVEPGPVVSSYGGVGNLTKTAASANASATQPIGAAVDFESGSVDLATLSLESGFALFTANAGSADLTTGVPTPDLTFRSASLYIVRYAEKA